MPVGGNIFRRWMPFLGCWYGREGAVGRWRARQPELTAACHAFRGNLAAKVVVCKPGDPEAKGLVERFHDYLEGRSCRAGSSTHRRISTPSCRTRLCGPITAITGCWGVARRIGSRPIRQGCWHWRPSGRARRVEDLDTAAARSLRAARRQRLFGGRTSVRRAVRIEDVVVGPVTHMAHRSAMCA
jgi:hypothetical protein